MTQAEDFMIWILLKKEQQKNFMISRLIFFGAIKLFENGSTESNLWRAN